jgi:acyl carrier protein
VVPAALWRGLVPPPGGAVRAGPAAGAVPAEGLRRQLGGLAGAERDRVLADLVRAHAAAVLGHRSAEGIGAGRAFKDLGFDSLTALELRNRLNTATGLRLPATLIFDCPTPGAVAGFLRVELGADEVAAPLPVIADLDQLESALSAVGPDCDMREDITRRLQTLLSKWIKAQSAAKPRSAAIELRSATPDEVFDFLDKELRPL